MTDALLDVTNLSVSYGKVEAVHDVSLTVAPGNIVVPVRATGLDAMAEALAPGVEVTLFNTADGRTSVIVPRIGVVRVVRTPGDRGISALLVQATPQNVAIITAANRAQSLDVGLPGSEAAVTTNLSARQPQTR